MCARVAIFDEGVHVMHDIEAALIIAQGYVAIEFALCTVNQN